MPVKFAKRDFSLLLSVMLMTATILLAVYIFARKFPDTSDKNGKNTAQQYVEPVVSTKVLPSPDGNLEFISDKLSETKQGLKNRKAAAALHNLEQIKAKVSRLLETETQTELKSLLQFILSETDTIERYIHLGEIDEALRHTQKLEQKIETE